MTVSARACETVTVGVPVVGARSCSADGQIQAIGTNLTNALVEQPAAEAIAREYECRGSERRDISEMA